MFVRIVQICSLATACIGQPLLTFCSHPEQSWMFALSDGSLVAALLKITLFCVSVGRQLPAKDEAPSGQILFC